MAAPTWRFDADQLPETAPFMARGILYSAVLTYLRDKHPGGIEPVKNLLGAHADQTGRLYLAASEYPIGGLVRISTAAAEASRRELFPFIRERAAATAEADLRGIYKLLLKITSPESTAGHLWKAFNRYFTPCTADTRDLGRGRLAASLHGIPSCIDGWYVASTEGFVSRAIELAGAKNIATTWSAPQPDAPRQGIPTSRIDFDVRWT